MTKAVETFFDAWGQPDGDSRHALLTQSVAEDLRYDDPRAGSTLIGRAALNDYLGMFTANAPGWTAKVVKSDDTAGMIRVTVAFGGKGPDGSDMVQHGQYFVETQDTGLISRMTGFVGTGAIET